LAGGVLCCCLEVDALLQQIRDQCIAKVLRQMEAVGYLNSRGRTLASTLRIRTKTVTTDDPHRGMLEQPSRHCLDGAIGQQIEHPVSF